MYLFFSNLSLMTQSLRHRYHRDHHLQAKIYRARPLLLIPKGYHHHHLGKYPWIKKMSRKLQKLQFVALNTIQNIVTTNGPKVRESYAVLASIPKNRTIPESDLAHLNGKIKNSDLSFRHHISLASMLNQLYRPCRICRRHQYPRSRVSLL